MRKEDKWAEKRGAFHWSRGKKNLFSDFYIKHCTVWRGAKGVSDILVFRQ